MKNIFLLPLGKNWFLPLLLALTFAAPISQAQDTFSPWAEFEETLAPNTTLVAALDPAAIDWDKLSQLIQQWTPENISEITDGWAAVRPLIQSQLAAWNQAGGREVFWSLDPTKFNPANPRPGIVSLALPANDSEEYFNSLKLLLSAAGPVERGPRTLWLGMVDPADSSPENNLPSSEALSHWGFIKDRMASNESVTLAIGFRISNDYRKALEELQPNLGPLLGNEDVKTLTHGVEHAMIEIDLSQGFELKATIHSSNGSSAERLHSWITTQAVELPKTLDPGPDAAWLVEALQILKKLQLSGDQLFLTVTEDDIQALALEMASELGEARDSAERIQCVNHLKQLSIGVFIYRDEHKSNPNTLADLIPYVGGSEKILICPAAKNATEENRETFRYEYTPLTDIKNFDPEIQVLWCPHHHIKALADGSVHIGEN